MTFKDLLLISTLVLYENLHYTNAVPTLDIKWRRPVIEKNLTFSCRSDGEITQSVLFLTKRESVSSPQGGCLASGTCDTAVPGYAVTQDRTARITTLFITSFDMNRDDQTWICKDGSSDSLEYNVPPTTLADIDCIPSQPGPIAKEGILTVTCETSCVYPEAKYSVEVLSGGSGPVPSVTSNDSCTGENVTTKNVFEMMGNSSQVACEVMFKVSIEHDSFIDFYPTYTLIKEIGPFMFPAFCPTSSATPDPVQSSTTPKFVNSTTTSKLHNLTTIVGSSSVDVQLIVLLSVIIPVVFITIVVCVYCFLKRRKRDASAI